MVGCSYSLLYRTMLGQSLRHRLVACHRLQEFWNGHLFMMEFDCPEVTLCDWQDINIQLIIMEICKRPTCRNILTAQGMHTSKNSDTILVTTTNGFFLKNTHSLTSQHTHTCMHTAHTRKQTRVQHVCIDTGKSTGNVAEVRVWE